MIVFSLYDHSRVWADAFEQKGIPTYSFDLQSVGLSDYSKRHVSCDFSTLEGRQQVIDRMTYFSKKGQSIGVVAAPPCTAFSRAGAWLWPRKDTLPATDPDSTAYGLRLFDFVLEVVSLGKSLGALTFWALENPTGRLWNKAGTGLRQNELGPPRLTFAPFEYGGYRPYDPIEISSTTIANRSEVSKLTYLWGDFIIPIKKPLNITARLDYGTTPGSRDITSRLNSSQKNLRQQTPRGFALAFAEAQVKGKEDVNGS